jgi:hypothetical protein
MAKDPNKLIFLQAKDDTVENLEALKESLDRCVDEGMIDSDDTYYNELLGLIDEASLAGNWDELLEVVSKGKTLETDVASWFSYHGQSGISLTWPIRPKT